MLEGGSKPKKHLAWINEGKKERTTLLIHIAQKLLTHSPIPQIVVRSHNHTLQHHPILAHLVTIGTREEKVLRK